MTGSESFDEEHLRLQELSELIQSKLGFSLEDNLFRSLAAVQKRLRDEQAVLASQLMKRSITKGQYIAGLERAVSLSNRDIVEVIGRKHFDQIFGPYTSATDIIDLDLFFGSISSESSRQN